MQHRPKCSYCQKVGHERPQSYELIGYPANWGNWRSNRQVSGAGYGSGPRNSRSSNPRNKGIDDKNRGIESSGAMTMTGTGGGVTRTGSLNDITRAPDLGLSGLSMENFGGNHGGEKTQGLKDEMGFARFTASQVDQLFALFKERQSQEKEDKMCGKCFHTPHMQNAVGPRFAFLSSHDIKFCCSY